MSLIIIDDSTPIDAIQPPSGQSRGLMPRSTHERFAGYGSMPFAQQFDLPLIPRSEWDDRISDMERTKTRVSDLMIQGGLPPLDQNGTNYCWGNGVITCMEAIRCVAGLPYVKLSPASVCAPIKNYRNQGGWGSDALEYIVENGVASVEHWPANAIDRKYFAPSRENAALHKVTEWYDLKPDNFDQLMTCLLLRIPVAVGFDWWSHLVAACDPVHGGGIRIRNSWGNWGDNGFGILTGSKAIPDDAVAPRVTLPSTN